MSCPINMEGFGPSPIPEEAKWVQLKDISQICGFSHGCGKCAPQQGTCKLTLNVKDGRITVSSVLILVISLIKVTPRKRKKAK